MCLVPLCIFSLYFGGCAHEFSNLPGYTFLKGMDCVFLFLTLLACSSNNNDGINVWTVLHGLQSAVTDITNASQRPFEAGIEAWK